MASTTRGALLDLFPMGSDQPYRIDFFDDEIDSLRLFDVDSQRTLEAVSAINLLPAHEFPPTKRPLSCSAAAGVKPSTCGANPSTSISR